MNAIYFIEVPLVSTRWENLTFNNYYNMPDVERQELREYLESINAPCGSNIVDEDSPVVASYITWRDIVSMSNDELEDYKRYLDARDMAPPMHEVECDNTEDSERTNYDNLPF